MDTAFSATVQSSPEGSLTLAGKWSETQTGHIPFIVLRLCGRPGGARLRAPGRPVCPRGVPAGRSLAPTLAASSSTGFLLSPWLPRFHIPLRVSFGSGPCLLCHGPPSPILPPWHAGVGSRGSWGPLDGARPCSSDWEGRRKGASLPVTSPPQQWAIQWGDVSRHPLAFSASGPSPGPHPGPLSHRRQRGWRPGPAACTLRRPASASPGGSLLCTGPLPPARCLEGPCRFLISTSASSPAQAPGRREATRWPFASALIVPVFVDTRTSVPTPSS